MTKNNKGNIMLVANWKSDVGYAWWLMENFWVQISLLSDENNKQCHLIYPELKALPESIASSSINTVELNYNDTSMRGYARLFQFVIKNQIDVIYLTDKRFFSLRYVFFKLLGVSKIIVHDHTPGERDIPRRLKRFLKKVMNLAPVVTADALIAVTRYVKDRHLYSSCIRSSKIHIAKNGIIPIGRNPDLKSYANIEFNIPDDAVIIFTSGRASTYKGIDFLIECANVLINQKKIDNIYFVYCGDGPDIDNFKDLSASYGLGQRFLFAGARSDVRRIVQSCHIGIQASKGEVGYSLSILEYMSAGLATLVPNNPSVCASIEDGYSGLVYKEGSIKSACEALVSAIENKGMREGISLNAQRAVKEDFNLNETNRAFKKIMKKLYFD